MKRAAFIMAIALGIGAAGFAHDTKSQHDEKMESKAGDSIVTLKGEVLDMACYLDHGAMGEKHVKCAQTCVKGGLPVGLKAENGKTYLLIGEHKSINDQLADYA